MIYMVHPRHGSMHVYDEQQARINESSGWKRADETAPVASTMDTVLDTGSVEKSLKERYAEKFGKPPHHRMTDETIRKALNG